MKVLLSIFIIYFLSVYPMFSQVCCPYVLPITVVPSNPTTNDTIKIIVTTSTPGLGHLIEYNYFIHADTIDVTGCFYNGDPTQPVLYIDTINIGQLGAGTYFVRYTGKMTSSLTTCIVEDSNTVSTTLEVTSVNDINQINSKEFNIYPNPVLNHLIVETDEGTSEFQVELINSLGQLCFINSYTTNASIDLSDLRSGFYTLAIITDKNKVIRKIVKL